MRLMTSSFCLSIYLFSRWLFIAYENYIPYLPLPTGLKLQFYLCTHRCMHEHKQTRTQTLIRSPVIFYLALQKRSVNWFIIFAVVHFKLQLQEMTSDEKLIGLSDTVMARRYKRRFISFCTNDWGGIIFPLVSILTHPTVKGCRQCHRQQTDSIFTGFIYIYIYLLQFHLDLLAHYSLPL